MSDQLELDFEGRRREPRAALKRPPDPRTALRIQRLRERYGRKRPTAIVIDLAEARRTREQANSIGRMSQNRACELHQLGDRP